jgi:N-acetylglutamate synthase-like GNAT family acetyltransferase
MASIRKAVSADVGDVEQIVFDAFRVYLPRMNREPAPMAADYLALVSSEHVWVAAEAGEIVGVVVLVPAADHLYLDTIAVRPTAQGRGVGARLMSQAEVEAVRLGLPAVTLCTNELMTENLAYYPRRGYRETHREQQHGFCRVFFQKLIKP